MSDNTDTIVPQPEAYIRIARKVSDGDYGVTEASVSVPIPVPADGPNSTEFLQTVREATANAKIEVLEALGIDFEVDPLTLTVQEKPKAARQVTPTQATSNVVQAFPGAQAGAPAGGEAQADQACGICGGPTYNNTAPGSKRNPKGPDYKCRDKACGAAMWLTGASGGTWKP